MKKFLFVVLSGFVLSGCLEDGSPNPITAGGNTSHQAAPADALEDSSKFTSIHWIDSAKNLGKINEGQKVEIVYRFENTGTNPLIIQSAMPSCGCTVPEKPEAPIMPGKQGSIKAVFDSQGRPGANHKTIMITTNTHGTTNHVLSFQVDVVGNQQATTGVNTATGGSSF